MRILYFGSGDFGAPTLRCIASAHDLVLVVTQPDRPAGRARRLAPTPIAALAERLGIENIRPEDVNHPEIVARLRGLSIDAIVVIAYGQKLGASLLADRFAINLHGSLLPAYRGAAPINRAMIDGRSSTGLSVITLAQRMDAGDILGDSSTPIDSMETAGELHDRLSQLGPDLVLDVLARRAAGTLTHRVQDESQATRAPKLTKAEGTVSFDQLAARVRARVHGLTPWPGCRVRIGERVLRLHRVRDEVGERAGGEPGMIHEGGRVVCADGVVRLRAVHPPNGHLISFEAYVAGHGDPVGQVMRPLVEEG